MKMWKKGNFHVPCGGMFLQGATRAIAIADIVCMLFAMVVNVTGTINAFRDLKKSSTFEEDEDEITRELHRKNATRWLWILTAIYFTIYAIYIFLGGCLIYASVKRSLAKCRIYMAGSIVLICTAFGLFIIHQTQLGADPYVIVFCLCFHIYKVYSLWVVWSFMKEIHCMGDYNDLLRDLNDQEIREFELGNPNSVFVQTGLSKNEKHVYCQPFNKEYEIPWDNVNIDYKTVLGTGAFGLVLRGKLTTSNGKTVNVAVKTTKTDADVVYFKALLMELKMMAFLGPHTNLVNLLGCITQDIRERRIWIVVELCSNGSLERYMKKHRASFRNLVADNRLTQVEHNEESSSGSALICPVDCDDACANSKPFTTEELLVWAYEIARGMEFLDSKKVVHGDLAARNILLTCENTVKITDFGLSRKLYNYEPYVKRDAAPLPWRYMAIESLQSMTFSTKSDVWAYGVTLWELFTLAHVPFAGMNWTLGFVDQLQRGLRLTKPEYATSDIYQIMCRCWHNDPDARPSFTDLKESMMELLIRINPIDYAEREDEKFCFYAG